MNAPPPSSLLRLLSRSSRALSTDDRTTALTTADLSATEAYARQRQQHLCTSRLHKRLRRVELGDACSLLFENRATVLSHLEEVRFLEGGAWSDERLAREIDAYRALLPQPGDLRATLFVHGGDARFGAALTRGLADGAPTLGMRVGPHEVFARSLDERWDPSSPVLYLGLRLVDDAVRALREGDDEVTVWLAAGGVSASRTLPAHTRFELEKDLWEAESAGGRRR